MHSCGTRFRNLTAAAFMPLAIISPAVAVPIGDMLGRWSADGLKDCANAENTEGAPLQVARDDYGTHIGNYGWLCSVKTWAEDGVLLKGSATCASEGGGDDDTSTLRLGLTNDDQLLLIDDNGIALYARCGGAH